MHIWCAYVALATILGIYHPLTMAMQALLDNWVGSEMELPGLLAPIQNGAATCVFWMSLQFYYYFQATRMQLGLGLPPIPCMMELMEQLCLHVFAQIAPCLPA